MEISPEELTGSWEKKGRSITAAAFTGLVIIGVIYFNVQSILISIVSFIYEISYGAKISGNFLERIEEFTSNLKIPILIVLIITQYLFMLLPVLWFVRRWHTKSIKKYLRIRRLPLKEVLLGILITIFAIPFCYYISSLLLKLFNVPEVFQEIESRLFTAKSLSEFVLLGFAIAITPAICEEIFFRGYFQRTLERTIGWKSIIMVGIVFGLFHFQPLGLISLSVLGILFSFFYYRSKSIFPSSAAHFTNNFIALILLYNPDLLDHIGLLNEGDFSILTVVISSLMDVGLILVYIRTTR